MSDGRIAPGPPPMPKRPEPKKASGGSAVILSTVFLLGVALFVTLNMLSLGVFTWVLAVLLAIVFFGFIHYVFWGQAMSQEVSEEREAFLRQQAREREVDERFRE